MSIAKQLDQDIIKALKAGEKQKLTVLRGLKSDLKYKQIDQKDELTDKAAIEVLSSAAKKRRESIEQYKAGDRQDLVDNETVELGIIKAYLPEQLSEAEIRILVISAIAESGAETAQEIGKVMKVLMPKVKGKADGKLVNKLVTEILAK
jgi:uncharacterized protein YqeY